MLQKKYRNTDSIIIAHGYVGNILGKSINGILMHSSLFHIVAIVDKEKAGCDTSTICLGVNITVPIFKDINEAFTLNPKVAILIGSPGKDNLEELKLCINNHIDLINSSFVFLNDFPELVNPALNNNTQLIDLRDVPRLGRDADGSILNIKAKVVFVGGTDCGLGKRTAAFELVNEAKKRGINAAFAATGQTGLMLGCDRGIAFDAIPINYTAGAIEKLVTDLDEDGFEMIFLEGQASIMHYGTSSVLTMLHASNPHAIVLVHDPTREYHVVYGNSPIFKMCELEREISIIENIYLPGGSRYKVVAVPTIGLENVQRLKKQIDLPVADVRQKGGPALILDAVLEHLEKTYQWQPSTNKLPV
ncbi:MAG: DUF1611 domain-containing protein [Bacteroidales bacterium]|nr:DUF1611 domain-containing protein [Bacteroidales bacterium]